MGETTKIQWCDHTFNPWRGCTKVSPGCDHCYAETMSKRNPRMLGIWGDNGTRVVASDAYWREPLRWDADARKHGKRARVFCASLADALEDRPELVEPRARLALLIQQTPNLDWLLLTKRPENADRLWRDARNARGMLPSWPANVWLGTTCEDQARAEERLPHLLRVDAAVRFVSAEPLLGPIRFADVPGLNKAGSAGQDLLRRFWVIVGSESGPGARPMAIEWARSIVDQCVAADVAVFTKQIATEAGRAALDRKGGDPLYWPAGVWPRQFPGGAQCWS